MASPKETNAPALNATTRGGYTGALGGSTGAAAIQEDAADEIPVRITLGDATLSMGASGQWPLEHSPLQDYIDEAAKLKARNEQLERENAQLKDRCSRLTEESNMEKFKCQLLVEMLALSSLDEEKSRSEADMERAKISSMKSDLQSLMDEARKQGVDVRKLGAILSVP